jgi:hypothetical protein
MSLKGDLAIERGMTGKLPMLLFCRDALGVDLKTVVTLLNQWGNPLWTVTVVRTENGELQGLYCDPKEEGRKFPLVTRTHLV